MKNPPIYLERFYQDVNIFASIFHYQNIDVNISFWGEDEILLRCYLEGIAFGLIMKYNIQTLLIQEYRYLNEIH
jgi:hypothetical protein